jgi:hypothetical protein
VNQTRKHLVPAGQAQGRRQAQPDGGVRITTFVPLQFKKRGIQKVVIAPPGIAEPVAVSAAQAISPSHDSALVKALALAHYWTQLIDSGAAADARDIAQREELDVTRVREIMRLAVLDPVIVEAVLQGRQVRTLSLEKLMRQRLPADWSRQREIAA